ncbi:hypothetical protein SOVF_211040 isoform B [Spinacia oleracea]|nr:hypothetical protein SOVF_211040 isoform B [Spinacia oleracea]
MFEDNGQLKPTAVYKSSEAAGSPLLLPLSAKDKLEKILVGVVIGLFCRTLFPDEEAVTSCTAAAAAAAASDEPVRRWTTSLKVVVSACTNVVNAFGSFTVFFPDISISVTKCREVSSLATPVSVGRKP